MQRRRQLTIFWGIVAGIGVSILLVVGWSVSKQYRWSGYRNAAYGFSIQYPANWTVKENYEGTAVFLLSPLENKLDFFPENVNVVVQDLSQKPMDLDKYSNIAIHQMQVVFKQNLEVLESDSTYLDGHPAHNFVFLAKGPDMEMKIKCVWTVIDETKAYQVTFGALTSQYDKYVTKVQKIIQSFQIL